MFGKVILDEEPHMFYRQHGNNEIGLTADKRKTFIGRVKRFLSGKSKNTRSNLAKSLLKVYGKDLDKEKFELLNAVANYDSNSEYKKMLLNDSRFLTESINDKFYKLLVIFNYI